MNLVEIAKSCGAIKTFLGITFTEQELHAYTEQVCKQMVEALESAEYVFDSHIENGLPLEHLIAIKQALASHLEMMGDRHE